MKRQVQLELPFSKTPDSAHVALVKAMAEQFGIAYYGNPRVLPPDELRFRINCLQEEIDEFIDATTIADQFDALLDLLVFTLGTMLRMGLPIDQGFIRVMRANSQKRRAISNDESKRGFMLDLVKPAGWTAPDLTDLTGEDDHDN